MAEELSESAKREMEANTEAAAKSREEYARRTKGKPTPTQKENDEAVMDKHFVEHEADGGDPDPYVARQVEAKPAAATYQTRTARPATRSSE